MNIDQTPGRWQVVKWTLGTFGGWALGFAFLVGLASAWSFVADSEVQFVMGLGMGCGVGLIQGLMIQRYLGVGWQWFIATVVGMGVMAGLSDVISSFFTGLDFALIAGIPAGALLTGVLQRRILTRFSSKAGWWIVISLAGWLLAEFWALGGMSLGEHATGNGPLRFVLMVGAILTGGVVLGATTGFGLIRILGSRV